VVIKFFGERANGIYALAYFIVLEQVKTIANVVIDVAFPAFAKLRNDRAALVDQLVQLTRLNVIAVMPFVMLILLVIPEFLLVFYSGGKWTDDELALCADATRMLCLVGLLRAIGFLGPPLLDGIGRPGLTLRYMVLATVVVPGMFVLGAVVVGPYFEGEHRLLSVAIGWAIGYPLAFGVLAYLVVKTIELPVRDYLARTWGMVGCCLAGGLAGLAASIALGGAPPIARMLVIGGVALGVMGFLIVTWQKITPRSIKASLR
jgi:teichuronic acid exporter